MSAAALPPFDLSSPPAPVEFSPAAGFPIQSETQTSPRRFEVIEPEPEMAPARMLDKSVCVTVELHGIGNSKQVSSQAVEVNADKDMLRVSKTLLDSEELKAIRKKDGSIRQFLYNQCVQSGIKWGFYLVPIASVERVEEKLKQLQREREALIDAWLCPDVLTGKSPYEVQVEAQALTLRDLYNPGDYPPAERVRQAFSFEWQYVSFGTPGKLKSISKTMFEEEQKKAARKWEEATNAVQQVLRANLLDMIEHATDKLTGKRGDGKPKIFRDSMVVNLKEFMATFQDRNITDDAELGALVSQANALIEGVDPKTLRTDDSVRDTVRAGFEAIKTQLDAMVTDRPKRAISFEDE